MHGLGGVFLCLALATSHQEKEADLFFSGVPQPQPLPEATGSLGLEFVREYGDRDEGLVFGNIVALAVNESGMLAVVDRAGCMIWVVNTESDEWHSIGGCGSGPGEFRDPQEATFIGDTLLVWDWRQASMMKITTGGEEIERFHVNPFEMGAVSLSDLHVAKDGSVLAGMQLLPNRTGSEDRQLAEFEELGGRVIWKGLVAPPLARNTPRNMVRSVSLCVGTTKANEEVVLALNHWGPQAVLLRRSDHELLHSVRVPVDWARSQEHAFMPGHWGPMAPSPKLACGTRFAVIGYRVQTEGSDGETVVPSAAVVLVDLWEGSLTVLGGDDTPEPGSVLLMTPGAAVGDRFFFFTNTFFDYPVVREYRVIRNGARP